MASSEPKQGYPARALESLGLPTPGGTGRKSGWQWGRSALAMPRPGATNGFRYCHDRFMLANYPLVEDVFQVHQAGCLRFGHPIHRNSRSRRRLHQRCRLHPLRVGGERRSGLGLTIFGDIGLQFAGIRSSFWWCSALALPKSWT